MKARTLAATAFCSLLATTATALESVEPGLWEHTYSITSESGQLEQAMEQAKAMMESLPPEQRKMVEDMMASQGISMDFANNTLRVCITEAQAQRNQLPQFGDNSCDQEIVSESDERFTVKFNCPTNPPSSGESTVHIIDSKAYNGDMVINTTMNGQPEKLTATTKGKWISADCGNVQPME